ncbi:MAG TPA: MoxR family ATPase [Kofleriaceae bacterium]|jgi:MoxR-like ATPase|nr:MoxR family ATPase [Kofleriaceae bacterium]
MPFDTSSPEAVARELAVHGYIADDALATSVFLALRMKRPLFLEGAPGVGKTMLARVLSEALATPLIRLQCHEGLDLAQAAYEWNYPRQLLELHGKGSLDALYREDLLLRRPLLQAIDAANEASPVLLIDEIDRADEEFESFLLELLGEFQITIPELGTIRAKHRPIVIVTSNRTRDVHDALKRRCLYHWIDYPSFATELAIVRARVPALASQLAPRVVAFVQRLRREDLAKLPGVAETVDWSEALAEMEVAALDPRAVRSTLGLLLKYHDDLERVRPALDTLLAEAAG